MKTIQVSELTWKTLSEMKLEGHKSTLEHVITDLIIEHCQNEKATGLEKAKTSYLQALHKLTHTQITELMIENFGEENRRYHTLDELPLNKILAKLDSSVQKEGETKQ